MSSKKKSKGGLASVLKTLNKIKKKGSKLSPLINAGLDIAGVPKGLRKRAGKIANGGLQAANVLFGAPNKAMKSNVQVPLSTVTVSSNRTNASVIGQVTSQFAGSAAQGTRIQGSQPFCRIVAASAVGKVLADDVAVTTLDGLDTTVLMNPLALNGPLLSQASNYTMFVFRKMRFEYTCLVGSTFIGELALCYVREPEPATLATGSVPTSFGEAREVTPSCTIPYRAENMSFEWSYDGQQLFYLHDRDIADEGDNRLSIQGQMRAYAAAVSSGLDVGYLTLHYVVDLFFPTINTVAVFASTYLLGMTKEELKLVARLANDIRSKRIRPVVRKLRIRHAWADSKEQEVGQECLSIADDYEVSESPSVDGPPLGGPLAREIGLVGATPSLNVTRRVTKHK